MTNQVSRPARWAGWVLSALPALLLILAGVLKLMKPDVKEFERLGYTFPRHPLTIGIIEIVCAILYLIPRTSVLGAILLTGYLGGAVATHVRIGDPSWFMPIIPGVLLWLGLYLREARLRALVPLRS